MYYGGKSIFISIRQSFKQRNINDMLEVWVQRSVDMVYKAKKKKIKCTVCKNPVY